MKRILSAFLAIALVFSIISVAPVTVEAAIQSNLTFELNADEESYSVTNCTNANGAITIPSTYYGKPVTGIGDGAFDHCYNLTSVTIPEGVTRIGEKAFYCCYQLSNIIIPKSVTSIGDLAFCSCEELTSVIIPEGVTTIGAGLFQGCSKLTSINLPASLTYIDPSAFWYCIRLQDLQLSEHNDNYSLDINGVLFNKDKTELVYAPIACIGNSYAIPNSVTSIGRYAFRGCNMTSITIPDSVATIGNGAFEACNDLVSITIPSSITTIGYNTFAYCTGLTEIIIPDKVVDIGNYAFQNCTGLTAITIPNSVSSIGDYAFYQCFKLKNVIILSDLLTVDSYTFASCNRLTDVWFSCSENDQNNFTIDSTGNTYFIDATWHYNFCDPANHIYDNSCDDACNACGYLRSVPNHIYTNDCDASCNECGDVRSVTHVFDHDCDAICSICSYERSISDHAYTNSCDRTCNICDYERNVSHVYDDADDLTCNVCKESLAPDRPTVESVTETSVTLVAFAGYEYMRYGTSWQKSNVFTGLEPGTLYVFFQRVAESADSLVSPASQPLHIWTTKYTPITPDEPIVESKTSTTVTLKAYAGYEYSIDGETWQADNIFSGLSPETQYTFYQRIAATSQYYASASSLPITVATFRTFAVIYNANGGDYAPNAQSKEGGVDLVLTEDVPYRKNYLFKGWTTSPYGDTTYEPGGNYTEDKDITLYAVWVWPCYDCGNKGHTYVTCSLCDGSGEWWGNISTCCYARTAYITITHGESGYLCLDCGKVCAVEYGSASCDKTTKKSCKSCSGLAYRKTTPSAAPQPVLLSATLSSIAVVAQSGMEYSIDGVTWQTSNAFEELLPNTQYTIYQRYKENSSYNAGESSDALFVSTLSNYQVGDLNKDNEITNEDVIYLLWHTLFPETYPVDSQADFTGDGQVTNEDVIYLLWHTLFPESYPLN